MSRELKPPLGLKPRFILDNERQIEILDACKRYIHGDKPIPLDWIDELREIAVREGCRYDRYDAQKREQDLEFQRTSDEAGERRKEQLAAALLPSGCQPAPATEPPLWVFKNGEVVEAFRMTRERREFPRCWPVWINHAWGRSENDVGSMLPEHWPHSDGKDRVRVRTSASTAVIVQFGEWIVRNHNGSLSVYDDGWFRRNLKPWCADEKPAPKACAASVAFPAAIHTFPNSHSERIERLAAITGYHSFDAGSGHCRRCGMHKSEYNPQLRDACPGYSPIPRSDVEQLILWARYHGHEFLFGDSNARCRNCGLCIREYEKVEWTTLVPCPATLPEGTTEV